MWGIWVSLRAAGAQACTPAGVHGLFVYSPEELLTSTSARHKNNTVCASRGALNLTEEGD